MHLDLQMLQSATGFSQGALPPPQAVGALGGCCLIKHVQTLWREGKVLESLRFRLFRLLSLPRPGGNRQFFHVVLWVGIWMGEPKPPALVGCLN